MARNVRVRSWLMRIAAREDGVAVVTVLLVVMVMVVLSTTMVANLVSELGGVHRQRRVTTARAAADAGVDRLIFTLQQSTNWGDFVTSYNTGSGGWWGWHTVGEGRFRAHVDCEGFNCSTGDDSIRVVTLEGEFPSGSGVTRKVQANLRRAAPEALTRFAMFGDRDIDIHHHGSSYVSPHALTTEVFSNGGISIDYTSLWRVDTITAVGSVTVGAGGSNPGDSTGYNWPYTISGSDSANSQRCYPPKSFPPKTIGTADPSFSTYWNTPSGGSCAGSPKYSPNAQVTGDVYGATVTISSNGDTRASASGTVCAGTTQAGINDPITGACIPDRYGDLHGHVVKVGSQTYTGVAAGNAVKVHYRSGTTPAPCSGADCVPDCSNCNQGTSDQGGHAGGSVYSHPAGWSPSPIAFPILDYDAYYDKAVTEQGGTSCGTNQKTCHVFPNSDGDDFIEYIANKDVVTGNYSTSSCDKCLFWLDSNKNDTTDPHKVAYVIARGTYFFEGDDINFDWQDIRDTFQTDSGKPTPVIMIRGALLGRDASAEFASSLTVVGPTMDPFQPGAAYSSTTVPGLIAATGGMHASDYDDDSSWTSSGQYEALKRNALTVRGLVYAGGELAGAKKGSVAADFHFHNYDPKNSTTIIGAQVGGKLHNCNSFNFSYDPLVQNLTGFEAADAGGSIYVTGWQEL